MINAKVTWFAGPDAKTHVSIEDWLGVPLMQIWQVNDTHCINPEDYTVQSCSEPYCTWGWDMAMDVTMRESDFQRLQKSKRNIRVEFISTTKE